MDKPNEFRTSGFYMEEGDVLRVTMIYEGGPDLLDVELVGDGVEANPTAPLVDLDGNEYTSVIIGSQEWIVENFRCTKYADGSSIPVVTGDAEWIADTAGAMCYYDNDKATYESDYGALYNWFAVNAGIANLSRNGVREVGWRVPSYSDFYALIQFIGGASVAGGKLKETGTTYWNAPNVGATDDYGFKARGGGLREGSGGFVYHKVQAFLWTTTEEFEIQAYYLILDTGAPTASLGDIGGVLEAGFSVRLVRDV